MRHFYLYHNWEWGMKVSRVDWMRMMRTVSGWSKERKDELCWKIWILFFPLFFAIRNSETQCFCFCYTKWMWIHCDFVLVYLPWWEHRIFHRMLSVCVEIAWQYELNFHMLTWGCNPVNYQWLAHRCCYGREYDDPAKIYWKKKREIGWWKSINLFTFFVYLFVTSCELRLSRQMRVGQRRESNFHPQTISPFHLVSLLLGGCW